MAEEVKTLPSTEDDSTDLKATSPQDREKARSAKAWASFQAFLKSPGEKCPHCWLMRRHCCCEGLPRFELRLRVIVLMHHLEIGQRKASNTAKLLAHFGAEMLCWGVEEHDERLQEIIKDDPEGTVVLFPSETAVQATELSETPRKILVLDGGWRECVRMNAWISRPLNNINSQSYAKLILDVDVAQIAMAKAAAASASLQTVAEANSLTQLQKVVERE
eukprot:s221_g31.t1